MGGRLIAIWDGRAGDMMGERCPVCGGNEDPCPTCTAWAALERDPRLAKDFAWVARHDQAGVRRAVILSPERAVELVRIGVVVKHPVGGWTLTGRGCDVIHATRAR